MSTWLPLRLVYLALFFFLSFKFFSPRESHRRRRLPLLPPPAVRSRCPTAAARCCPRSAGRKPGRAGALRGSVPPRLRRRCGYGATFRPRRGTALPSSAPGSTPATRGGTGAEHCAAGSSARHGVLGGKRAGLRINSSLPKRHPQRFPIRHVLHRLNFPDHVSEEPPSKKYHWVPAPRGLGRPRSPPAQLCDTRAPLPGAATKFRVFRVPECLPQNAPSETFSGWTGAVPPRFSAPLRGAARTVRGAESPQSRQLRSAGSLPSPQPPPPPRPGRGALTLALRLRRWLVKPKMMSESKHRAPISSSPGLLLGAVDASGGLGKAIV